MDFTKAVKIAVVCCTLAAVSLCVVIPSLSKNQLCFTAANQTETLEQCHNTAQQSWSNWVVGHSRSTQFHFVDFLELLSRLSPAKKP